MDATICSKRCRRLDPAQGCVGADCQTAEISWRNISKATQATLWKSWHSRTATPWSIENKVASAKPEMAAFATELRFRVFVYGAMSASCYLFLGSI